MLAFPQILFVLLLLLPAITVDARKALSPSQRHAGKIKQPRRFGLLQLERQLQQKDDTDNNKDNDENDKDKNEDQKDVDIPTTAPPTIVPTVAPAPTPAPVSDSPVITVIAFPPSLAPTRLPVFVATEEATPTVDTNNDHISLSSENLHDIQYFGGGQITLRFSLWLQDQTTASEVGTGPTLIAVLKALDQILCQPEEDSEADPLGLDALDWADASQVENRELCVVPLELGGAETRFAIGGEVETSVLLKPPTTFVVDRTASNSSLRWTTWRVTWDVLRLGTFHILQGLENAGADASTLSEEEIHRAGLSAMQGILELALEVSIREQAFDKMLVGGMVQFAQSEGMVISSIYGEEVQTLEPKLEWLGLAKPSEPGGEAVEDPTIVASNTTDTASDADPEGDDDRYSEEYGITEPLDPEFWHPLRIVGMVMFFLTTTTLVLLSHMSRKRQASRDVKRKMAKEGLLNNPQSVENMLKASGTRRPTETTPTVPSASQTTSAAENKDVTVPMSEHLPTIS